MKIKPNDAISFIPYTQTGITYREYYAGLALQGLTANGGISFGDSIAKRAVVLADDLINELNKEEK